jgi:hypothetical protein
MSKLTFFMALLVLAGCAEWRGLHIDGSSTAAFEESISRLEQELPGTYHREMFALALRDVAADESGIEDTDENYRAELDGLTYNGVIALADRAGTPVKRQYYSRRGHSEAVAEQLHQRRLAEKTAPYFPPSPDWSR